MNLVRDNWDEKDILELEDYLTTFSKGKEASLWEQRIVNTSLPCLAIPSEIIQNTAKQIYKGDFMSFINLFPWNYHAETMILGALISRIKDFDTYSQQLLKFAKKCDNWSSCDTLKFNITSQNKTKFFKLAQDFISSAEPFVRRVGFRILFKFIDDEHIDTILNVCNSMKNEQHYYVNMVVAWLLCECFVKQREKTLAFLLTNNLNDFTLRKMISKCIDSYRVSAEDKEYLKSYKQSKFSN